MERGREKKERVRTLNEKYKREGKKTKKKERKSWISQDFENKTLDMLRFFPDLNFKKHGEKSTKKI